MTEPAAQLDLIYGHGLAEQAGRRVTIAELAAETLGTMERANTVRAFRGDWKAWLAFCEMAQRDGIDALPLHADPKALVVFANWLAQGGPMPDGTQRKSSSPETIRRRLTGVLAGWKDQGIDFPRGISQLARIWVNDYERKLIEGKRSTGRGQAIPLRVEEIHRIAATTNTATLAGLRDMAVVTLDFSIGGRRAELAALDVSDISVTPGEGMEIHVRSSKTGARKPWIPYGEFDSTCPVRCWLRWQQRSAIITGGALRRVTRYDTLGPRLSGAAVSEIVARAGVRAKLDGRRTGHSVRRGFATEAASRGRAKRKIADQGGWQRNSTVLESYIDDAEKRTDSVLKGMGL